MLKYPSVILPTVYYSAVFSYASVMFTLTASAIFSKLYDFQPYQTGLLLGVPITVGGVLGELVAGAFSDRIGSTRAMRRQERRKPEDRLLALLPAVVLCPLGIILEGVCVARQTHWIGPAMAIGIASFILQIATTIVFTYTAECFRPQAADLGLVLSFCRAAFSFGMGFYALPLSEAIGIAQAWSIFAAVILASSLAVLLLLRYGEMWRRQCGSP